MAILADQASDLDSLYNLYALDLWPDGDDEPADLAAPADPHDPPADTRPVNQSCQSCQHLLRTGPETGWCWAGQGVVCFYDSCPDWLGRG